MAKIIKNNCKCGKLKDQRAKVCRKCLYDNTDINNISNKKCTKCNLVLSINQFRTRKRSKGGKERPRSWCKECERKDSIIRTKQWKKYGRKTNPISKEESLLKQKKSIIKVRLRKFNITDKKLLEEYSNIYLNQKICPICLKESSRPMNIDHCHQSGKFRGFICSNCNSGLGMFKDDLNTLARAINYLSNFYLNP